VRPYRSVRAPRPPVAVDGAERTVGIGSMVVTG
jgi:hypothetical protein